ncbi:MAG: hypothetical protein ACI4E1_10325 [Lachnospira sp.]
MAKAFKKALETLKEKFSGTSNSKEYVLIPEDDMIEIATDNVAKRISLSEVVDILNFYPPKE